MTENNDLLDIADDAALGWALRAEVPSRNGGYWLSIDERIAAVSEAEANNAGTSEGDPDISTAATKNTDMVSTGMMTRLRTWPAFAAAAAVILIAGLLAVRLLPSNNERVEAGFAEGEIPAALEDLPGPTQNVDHWNAIYGVWDCTADGGNGAWLPAFHSTDDDVGVHSHGDGLISIHPFFEESAGRNATFSHFADAMRFTITDDTIILEDGSVLTEGVMCSGRPAVLEMYRWQDARALDSDPTISPRIITADFGAERFYNNFEVWTLALTPIGTPVPLPPQDRFDELKKWWLPSEDPGALTPVPVAQAEARPPHDTFTAVRRAETGANADAPVREILAWASPRSSFSPDSFVAGSATRWTAVSQDARSAVDIVEFEFDNASRDSSRWACLSLAIPQQQIVQSASCADVDNPAERGTSLDFTSILPSNPAISLTGLPADAIWLIVTTETGTTVLANVVDGISYAAWPSPSGQWTSIEALNAESEVVWSETCRLPSTMFCTSS